MSDDRTSRGTRAGTAAVSASASRSAGSPAAGDPLVADALVADAPLLDDVMPWSVPPPRLGRGWIASPDADTLRARWRALTRTEDEAERKALFGPTRSRTLHSAVAPLPGTPPHEGRLLRESGGCPRPVRILHGPYDQQWLIPDHRLIDAARPQLWRVSDGHQTHLVETPHDASRSGPLFTFTALLPGGRTPAGRPGRIRPLYRRPGGDEPNVLPGLLGLLTRRLGEEVSATDLFAWTAAAARPAPAGRIVPLTADPALWRRGVALGRRMIWLHTRGARCAGEAGCASGSAGRPRLPGGHRPYVRAPLPAPPASGAGELGYDAEERSLLVGDGRIAPVAPEAWEFEAAGVRVLEDWFAQRTPGQSVEPGTLEAMRPRAWPQEWTSELLELITVLTLLAELHPEQRELASDLDAGGAAAADGSGGPGLIGRTELSRAGLLPAPAASRRPASVLDVPEEGPEGQLALL